jgi:glucose uptake protein GlcU
MNRSLLILATLAVMPVPAHAQGLQDMLTNMALFIDSSVIPFLFGVAFLVFIINAVRFFVLQSSNETGREKARNLMMYSILAFVFLIIFWGLINLLSSSLGLEGCDAPVNDYQKYNATGLSQPGC